MGIKLVSMPHFPLVFKPLAILKKTHNVFTDVSCWFVILAISFAQTDVSVNTTRSLVGPPVRAVSEEALCGVLLDLDRLTSSLDHRSVVDDAFFEVENIRLHHLAGLDKASGDVLNAKHVSASHKDSINLACDNFVASSLTYQSNSLTTRKTDFHPVLPKYGPVVQEQTPIRCYAAALTSGKPRSITSVTSSNSTDSEVNSRGTKLHCTSRTVPLATCSTRTLSLPLLRSSMFPVRNKNQNNTEMLHEITHKVDMANPEQVHVGLLIKLASNLNSTCTQDCQRNEIDMG